MRIFCLQKGFYLIITLVLLIKYQIVMSFQGSSEINQMGTPFGGGFGGWGGWGSSISPFGLIGLLGGGGGHHHHDCGGRRRDDDCARDLLLLKAIGDNKDTVTAEGRMALKEVSDTRYDLSKAVSDTRYDIGKAVCDARHDISKDVCDARSDLKNDIKDTRFDLTVQGIANTQNIKDQAQAFQIANDRKFEELEKAGERQTAVILAKLNQTEIDNLRDALLLQRDKTKELKADSTVTQLGIAFGNQIQATNSNVVAIQNQFSQLIPLITSIANQQAKAGQDIINIGGLLAGVSQTANPVNVKS